MKKQTDSQIYIQACLVFLVFISVTTASGYHDYCIIGAGPGGLQLGYYLQQQNRDYIIYERTNISGMVLLQKKITFCFVQSQNPVNTSNRFLSGHHKGSLKMFMS